MAKAAQLIGAVSAQSSERFGFFRPRRPAGAGLLFLNPRSRFVAQASSLQPMQQGWLRYVRNHRQSGDAAGGSRAVEFS
jgi:hypothetical protein